MVVVYCDYCYHEVNYSYCTVRHTYGYGSPRDGDHVTLHYCESCLEKLEQKAHSLRNKKES